MTATNKAFLDTNVLLYAHDRSAGGKQRRAYDLAADLGGSGAGVISTQVMQEFYSAATRKLKLDPLAAKTALRTFEVFELVQVSSELVYSAVDVSILNRLSFWDGLILAAASAARCSLLYSEDMRVGQTILGITVRNPFL